MKILRRKRPLPKPAQPAWVDAEGYKTPEAPKNWPFGMVCPPHIVKRVNRRVKTRLIEKRADAPTRPDKGTDPDDLPDAPF